MVPGPELLHGAGLAACGDSAEEGHECRRNPKQLRLLCRELEPGAGGLEKSPSVTAIWGYAMIHPASQRGSGAEQRFGNPRLGVPKGAARYKTELLCQPPKPRFVSGVPSSNNPSQTE